MREPTEWEKQHLRDIRGSHLSCPCCRQPLTLAIHAEAPEADVGAVAYLAVNGLLKLISVEEAEQAWLADTELGVDPVSKAERGNG